MANVVLNSETIDFFKQRYPSLINITYDHQQNKFVINGNMLDTNEITIDERLMMMETDDISTYLAKRFYKGTEDNTHMDALFNKFILTETDYEFIQEYINNFNDRIAIYLKYKNFFDQNMLSDGIGVFLKDTLDGKKIIDEAKKTAQIGGQDAASILTMIYAKSQEKSEVTEETPNTDEQNTNTESHSLSHELVRTRTKASPYKGWTFDEEEYIRDSNHLDAAGFTSILAIIAVTLVLGIYLAITLLR